MWIFIYWDGCKNNWSYQSYLLVYSKLLALMAAFQEPVLFTVIGRPPEDEKSNFLNICSQDQSSARLFWCLQWLRGLGFTVRGVFIIYIIRMQAVFIFPFFPPSNIPHFGTPRVSLLEEAVRWRRTFNARKCDMRTAPRRLLFGKIMRWVKDFQET